MLGLRNKTDEQISQDLAKRRDEAIVKATRLRKLTNKADTGWKEYYDLITDYIEKAKKRKALTALDIADDKTIQNLRLLDHEIFILMWALKIPQQFIINLEAELKRVREEEENV